MPAGLYLTTDGYIGGTPTATGTGDIQVRASYKTAKGEQTYQVVSIPLMVAMYAAVLPAARVGSPYSYDFKSLLWSNDPAFTGDKASFSATGLPEGLNLDSTGVLLSAPTVKNEAGSSFHVLASYKTETRQQAYTIGVNGAVLQVKQVSAGNGVTCAVTLSGGAKFDQSAYPCRGGAVTIKRVTGDRTIGARKCGLSCALNGWTGMRQSWAIRCITPSIITRAGSSGKKTPSETSSLRG